MPSFLEIVARARASLRENERVSLRALRREFELDDEALEDLIEELVDVQQVAERGERMLSWRGGPEPVTTPGAAAEPGPERAKPRAVEPSPATPAPVEEAPLPETDSAERRQLTVMFCDLVGSTQLAERVDPEELRQIVHDYRAVCVEATKRFEGHVAQYLGDGVLIYFGYPLAHEDAAARGIRAGLEIQRKLAEHPEVRRVGARIGIHTGLVVVDDDALALGSTTNLAARIEAVAEPGSVVVSDATLALCRGAFLTREIGPQALKGIDEPVLLHRVDALVRIRSAVDAEPASRPMVGRDRELGLVLDRWEEAREGHGQVVLVSGEPGVGKSRLIQALHDGLGESQHLWLDLRCSPYTRSSAFQPLVDLFATGLDQDDTGPPQERARRLVAGLEALPGVQGERVIPYLLALLSLPVSERHPLPETSAEERRERTFNALVELLIHLSEQQPVVLVGEDLHWSDPSTLEYFERIVAQAPTLRLLLVLTFRPEFEPPWSQSHVSEVRLGRLPRRATRELIENAVGGKLPEPVLAELESRSDGVPLFVEELAASVVTSGVLARQAGRLVLRGGIKDLAIPATLQDSLMARLDRLSASKHVAQQAATLGREFSYELIEAVTPLDPPSLRTALEQLVDAEVLHRRGTPPDATYTFRHSLFQDTAYESQLLSTRKALHAKVASVLEERFPVRVEAEPELMARHCQAAGDAGKAVDHFERAADLALARVSNQEASTHYASALAVLEELPEDDERRQREVTLRLAHWQALVALRGFDENSAELGRVRELADELGEGPPQIPALLGLALAEIQAGNFFRCMENVDRLFPIAEELGIPQLRTSLYFLRGVVAELCESSARAVELLTRALDIAKSIDFPPPATANVQDMLANCYGTLGIAQVNLGLHDQALESLAAGRARLRELGNDFVTAASLGTHGIQAFETPDPELARSLGDEALAACEGCGWHGAELLARSARGWGRAALGDIEGGIADVERAVEIYEKMGARGGVSMAFVMAADVYRMAGDRERCEAFLARAEEYVQRYGEAGITAWIRHTQALLCLDLGSGDPLEAEALLLEGRDLAAAGDRLNLEIQYDTQLARLAPRTGKVREAHDRLAATLARLTEGLDRDHIREARSALEDLAPLLS